MQRVSSGDAYQVGDCHQDNPDLNDKPYPLPFTNTRLPVLDPFQHEIKLRLALLARRVVLIEPLASPAGARLPIHSLHPLGAALLLLLGAYLAFCALRRRPVKVRGSELAVPAPRLALMQVVLSSLDWVIAGTEVKTVPSE